MFKNFKLVDKVVFGRGSFNQLDDILQNQRKDEDNWIVFFVDHVFINSALLNRIPLHKNDKLMMVDTDNEPTTYYVDELTQNVRDFDMGLPSGVIGIGGGTTMDLAKAVSLMLTNEGSAADYQGWDLIQNPAIYHCAIPTLSGTGAEVSRTTVLTGPIKKLGINSDWTVFNQIILDPDLIDDVPANQRFYTAMDCYVHNVESLTGTFINSFARSFGEKSYELCKEVFLTDIDIKEANEKLMMASLFGGLSIAYSQVGVCHALSYGLSYVLKTRHGLSNCIVFDQLEEFYPDYVIEFKEIVSRNGFEIPKQVTKDCTDEEFEKMIDISLVLVPLWENALGKDWQNTITRDRLKELFKRM